MIGIITSIVGALFLGETSVDYQRLPTNCDLCVAALEWAMTMLPKRGAQIPVVYVSPTFDVEPTWMSDLADLWHKEKGYPLYHAIDSRLRRREWYVELHGKKIGSPAI